jgi:hypothetical protein
MDAQSGAVEEDRCSPRCDGLPGESKGQITSPAQPRFILRPIPDAVPLLGVLQLAAFRISMSNVAPTVLENLSIS